MDFIRKGAQAASKLGNKILEAVEDQNNFGGASPASSSHDLEVDLGVRRAKVLTASLKGVGQRAIAFISSLKQNGANAVHVAQVALEGAKDEFGDDSTWSQASEALHQVLFEVDSKFTAQLCSLLQRDVVDPITRELEANKQITAAIEELRQGISAGNDKLDVILARRRALLASVVAALVGHQANYHARLGAQYAPLTSHVAACKAALPNAAKPGGARPVSASPERPSAPAPAPKTNSLPAASPQGSPPRQSPVAASVQSAPPPAKASQPPPAQPPAAKPAPEKPQAEADLLSLNSASPKPPPPAPSKSPEADLLGGWGDETPPAKQEPAKVSAASNGAASSEGDLLGGLWEASPVAKKPAAAPSKPADLLDFGGGVASPAANTPSSDPFESWMGATAKPAAPQKQDSLMALFGGGGDSSPAPSGGRGGGGAVAHGEHPGWDNADHDSPKAAAKQLVKRRENKDAFSGTGTDRAALKEQFNQHVQQKAEEAAALVRQREQEKADYDDMKWKLADAVDQKIIAWAGPKHNRKNLRAMLATFQTVIFEEAREKWKPVGLHELVLPDQVKKIHRKAILLVHPDKVQQSRASMESKLIAEHVHSVLHEALDIFRKQEAC